MSECYTGCTSYCIDSCNNSCSGKCKDACTACTGSCKNTCDNACSTTEVSKLIRDLKTRKYGIVFTSDYRDLITVLLKDLKRRNITVNTSPTLSDDAPNTTEVIDYIVQKAKKLGYSSAETYGIIKSDQMERLQTYIAESASIIRVK